MWEPLSGGAYRNLHCAGRAASIVAHEGWILVVPMRRFHIVSANPAGIIRSVSIEFWT